MGGASAPEASHPLEVVDDVSWVSVVELGHGDVDELHLLPLKHLDSLLQLPQLELVGQIHLHLKPGKGVKGAAAQPSAGALGGGLNAKVMLNVCVCVALQRLTSSCMKSSSW